MIIKRIELTNWGPHQSLKADLTANVVGVIGGNGKGKSNFLQAIDYGLNGNLNKQNKECYIYNFGKEDGATKATVKIEFSKNGQDGEITRSITKAGSSRKLVWEGKEYKSDAEVSAQMAKIMGADKAAMANAIFIKQGCLAALVKGTPAERLSIFQKLMNLSFLDSRYNDLHGRIEKLKKGVTDYRPALDVVAAQLASTKDQIEHWTVNTPEDKSEDIRLIREAITAKTLHDTASVNVSHARGNLIYAQTSYREVLATFGYTDISEIDDVLTQLNDDIAAYQLYSSTKESMDTVNATIQTLSDAKASLTEELLSAKAKVLSLQEEQVIRDEIKTLNDQISELEAIKALKRRLSEAISYRQDIENKLKQCRTKAQESTMLFEASAEMLESLIASKASEINTLRLRKAYLEGEYHEDVCPVCGNHLVPVDDATRSTLLAEVQNALADAEKLHERAVSKKEILRSDKVSAELAVTLTEKQLQEANSRVTEVEEKLKQYTVNEDVTVESLTTQRYTLQEKLTVHSVNSNIVESKKHSIQAYDKQLAVQTANLIRLQDQLNKLNPDAFYKADLTLLTDSLNKAKLARNNVASALSAVTAAETMLNTFRQQFDAQHESFESNGAVEWVRDTFNMEDLYVDELEALLPELESHQESRRMAEATISNLRTTTTQLITERQRLLDKMKVEEERLQLIDDLETVARMTNKNGLPLAYMNNVFDHITGMVQEMLSRMGANFTVIKDDERPCTFRFIRTDDNTGYSMPQEMLSGGQAIRLSLALLIACQQLILPEVGLLVLDEPSSHMDAEGVDSLKELFLQMTSIFHSSETQLITVDHNPCLIAALEKVIQL